MTSTETTPTPPQGVSLSSLRLTELKALAQQMGLKGLSGKRKSDLIAMIEGGRAAWTSSATAAETTSSSAPALATSYSV